MQWAFHSYVGEHTDLFVNIHSPLLMRNDWRAADRIRGDPTCRKRGQQVRTPRNPLGEKPIWILANNRSESCSRRLAGFRSRLRRISPRQTCFLMDKAIVNQTYETNHRSPCHGIPPFVPTNIWPTSLAASAARGGASTTSNTRITRSAEARRFDDGFKLDTIRPEFSRRHTQGTRGGNREDIGETTQCDHTG